MGHGSGLVLLKMQVVLGVVSWLGRGILLRDLALRRRWFGLGSDLGHILVVDVDLVLEVVSVRVVDVE